MSTEVLAGIIATLLGATVTLLAWIVVKLNTISTLIAVEEHRFIEGDKILDDHEKRIRAIERANKHS